MNFLSSSIKLIGLLLVALVAWGGPLIELYAQPTASPTQAVSDSGLPAEQAAELLRSERFRQLASELRCLVCQNQTLADSNAELAADLRNEVLRQMAQGKDDAQIKAHLVDRFGEFVLYRPSFAGHNLVLWAGPAVLVGLGALVLWQITRRRERPPTDARLETGQLERIDQLLAQTPDPANDRSRTTPPDSARRG
jgi:cytochrome c-type biogenesis protein CcmH